MPGFVVVESESTYITIDGTLYFFLRREDAEYCLSTIKDDAPSARVEKAPVYQPYLYVLRSSVLKLLVIKEVRSKEGG